jgi:hypothetical protein
MEIRTLPAMPDFSRLVLALQRHCTENEKKIHPEMKLRGLVPNFYIPSARNLYVYSHDWSAYFAAGK